PGHILLVTADNDHDMLGPECGSGIQYMAQHRQPGHRMQHLGQPRLHARALPRGQYDDSYTWFRHAPVPCMKARITPRAAESVIPAGGNGSKKVFPSVSGSYQL